jgi:alcohol dehydrogenase class IV
MWGFFTAPSIAFGPGAFQQLSALGARRALLVVDPALAERAETRRVPEELAKGEATVESVSVPPGEPTVDSVESLLPRMRSFSPDWIVALGGGSTIDTAKGLWIRYARPELDLAEITPLVELSLRSRARFAALPTTVGSGSEATGLAQFRTADHRFLEVSSRELVPDWAIVDPAFLGSLPPRIAAETAADALAHALEAAVSEWANPYANAQARETLATALPLLPRVLKHWDDPELRGALAHAATSAGLAASNAQIGVAHALAHALSTEFPVAHGRLVAALMPYVAEFNYPAAREKYAALAPALGVPVQHRSSVAERLRGAGDPVGLPRTLADAGVSESALAPLLEVIVARAHSSPGVVANPRVPSPSELRELLLAAVRGSPVTF